VAEAEAPVKEPTPRRLKKYVSKCLRLKSYLQAPGDGRKQGRIPATALLWASQGDDHVRPNRFSLPDP
jgi:hypothetical protein